MRNLGLGDGDVVFVSSDLMKVGYFNKDRETTMRDWVEILLDVVGVTGTVVVPSYSPAHLWFVHKSDFVYTEDSASDSGSLATAFLSLKGSVRGAHPTGSCVAIGPLAKPLLASTALKTRFINPTVGLLTIMAELMLGIRYEELSHGFSLRTTDAGAYSNSSPLRLVTNPLPQRQRRG